MTDFLNRWAQASDANARLVAQETLIAETTESLWELMQDAQVNKTDLAERLGATKGYVSQLLTGSRNMTLRTLADLCHTLGARPHFFLEREASDWHELPDQPTYHVRQRPNLRLVVDNQVESSAYQQSMVA